MGRLGFYQAPLVVTEGGMFTTDKIGLACYLLIKGVPLTGLSAKARGRAAFDFDITAEDALAHEMAYTTSDHARFFEAFRLLRERAVRGK